MATRNILDRNGQVIGQATLPDTATEEDWQRLLAPYATDPVREIPNVTPRQIRQAMILSGVTMQMIDDALATLPEPTKSLAKVEWEYSVAFIRTNPLVSSVGAMLGWTPQQLDDLWLMAGRL